MSYINFEGLKILKMCFSSDTVQKDFLKNSHTCDSALESRLASLYDIDISALVFYRLSLPSKKIGESDFL